MKVAESISGSGFSKADGFRESGARTVLLYTVEEDFHADVIGHTLESRGHRVIRWEGQSFPECAAGSALFTGRQVSMRLRVDNKVISSTDVDVVWYRRRTRPVAPPVVDRRDTEFVTAELRAADASYVQLFPEAFWINTRAASDLCDIKVNQLLGAKDVGLIIPRTLISNDPVEIVDFISSGAPCIYKPLVGHVWSGEGRTRKTYTADVSPGLLPKDRRILQAAPGIYQEKIRKAYEVRVQFFGASYMGIRIESSKLVGGDLDWRIDQLSIASCEPVLMPVRVYKSCRALMKKLGIVSGGFDFIVDEHGRWVFMEVNEAGQFLFIEAWCRDLPVLDAFCQFVESADPNFIYEPKTSPVTLKTAFLAAETAGALSSRRADVADKA